MGGLQGWLRPKPSACCVLDQAIGREDDAESGDGVLQLLVPPSGSMAGSFLYSEGDGIPDRNTVEPQVGDTRLSCSN